MSTQLEKDILPENESDSQLEEAGPTTLISAAKRHEAKLHAQALASEFTLDPMYTPFIEAANELRQRIESSNKQKIEDVKRETAEQTKNLYNKLTEAREEFKRLQSAYQIKTNENEKFNSERTTLQQQLDSAYIDAEKYQKEIQQYKITLDEVSQKHQEEFGEFTQENNALIEKLKQKIEQINQDYHQQITNLQQKLNYQKQQFIDESSLFNATQTKLADELSTLKEAHNSCQQRAHEFTDNLMQAEAENLKLQHELKEQSERLLRSEHAIKLANEELERSQHYVKELEEKNNAIQKELFENWICKKEEL